MPTSALPDILIDIHSEEPIPADKIAYLVARAKLRLHDLILRKFAAKEDKGLDQATIARRLGVSRARISQQMGVPGNWTLESVTKLAAAIGGEINFDWIPFPPSEAEMKIQAKTVANPPEEPPQAFQPPDEITPISPEETDEHP
jgi:transcriptional regulator with XRE-family HTH domain